MNAKMIKTVLYSTNEDRTGSFLCSIIYNYKFTLENHGED